MIRTSARCHAAQPGEHRVSVFKRERLPPEEQSIAPSHCVLVVDDEPGNLSVLRALLLPRYRVLEAGGGATALALLDSLPPEHLPSVILSDQRMPGMSGVELCSQLARRLPQAIRIIVTGFVDVGAVVEAINSAGIHKFVVKPYDRDQLLLTVERAVETFEMRRRIELQVQELEATVRQRTAELEAANAALRAANAEIERASLTDPLTGLGNRRDASRRLEASADERRRNDSGRQVVLMLDIDHFKQVNDRYGHSGGDALLVAFADLLRRHCRSDDLAVRWGGEEFLMRFGVRDEAHALARAEALRIAIREARFPLGGGKEGQCTSSIGLACLPLDPARPDWLDWQQVIDLADHALYLAKHGGRDRVVGLFATGLAPCPSDSASADALLSAGCIEVRAAPSGPKEGERCPQSSP
jgi:diguanylate cyclase (GGDEF)-like protein